MMDGCKMDGSDDRSDRLIPVGPFPDGRIVDPAIRARMSRQAARDTKPELALRRELHRRGLRYRVDAPLPDMPRRRADLLFRPTRVAVFVDGCFWHCCPEHGVAPKNNSDWWESKLGRNVQRDRDTDRHLMKLGWTVLRFWEHEDMIHAAGLVEQAVREARAFRQ